MGWGKPKCPKSGQTDKVGKNDDGKTYNCKRCDEIFYADGTLYKKISK